MPLIKLLFHHDLPLEATDFNVGNDLLALFAKPQRTYSKLWLSVSDIQKQTFALSSFESANIILKHAAISLQTTEDVLSATLAEPVLVKLNGSREPEIERFSTPLPDSDCLKNQPEQTLVLKREPGAGGFDLCILSLINRHAQVFNALVPLLSVGFNMLSINGKRVHRKEMLYEVDQPGARLPHGFEVVQPEFRM
jgi:hypothetical protein